MFKSNAAFLHIPHMSLNRFEQALFVYLEANVDERRHWQSSVSDLAMRSGVPGEAASGLERDLWNYLVERSAHVPQLRELGVTGLRRVSLLNLAEHLLRLWG